MEREKEEERGPLCGWWEAVQACAVGAEFVSEMFSERCLNHWLEEDGFSREWRSEYDPFGRLWVASREATPGAEFVVEWVFELATVSTQLSLASARDRQYRQWLRGEGSHGVPEGA